MQQYVTATNRIIRAIGERASMTGKLPSLIDFRDQIAIRSVCLSRATINLEISAVRNILTSAEIEGGEVVWSEGVDVRDWMTHATQEDLETAKEAILAPRKDILALGAEISELNVALAERRDNTLSYEEMIGVLSGMSRDRTIRQNQKDQRHLTWRDLMAIEMELSGRDPYVALDALRKSSVRGSVEGLLRVFVNVIWFSGMRPTEVWDCRLFVPRFDLDYGRAEIEMIERRPMDALRAGLLSMVDQVAREISEPVGFTANQACERVRVPAILLIKSAKQTNAVREIRMPARLQILKNIPTQQLSLIAIVASLHQMGVSRTRQENIHSAMGKALKRIGERNELLAGLNLNLYAFRHSFATRAKLAYEPWEAAALTGHTAKRTLYAYGERNRRRGRADGKSAVRPENWLPLPDPLQAAAIDGWWSRADAPAPGATPGTEPEIAIDMLVP